MNNNPPEMEIETSIVDMNSPIKSEPILNRSLPTSTTVLQRPFNDENTAIEENVAENKEAIANIDRKTLQAVMHFLKKNNLNSTIQTLSKETNFNPDSSIEKSDSHHMSSAEVNSLLSSYSNEADPCSYEDNYRMLQRFVDGSLDVHKWELAQLLYPVFVHMYLELVYNHHKVKSSSFFQKFRHELESFHETDLLKLSAVSSKFEMEGNCFVFELRSNKYVVRLSADSNAMLKQQLQDKNMPLVQNVIQRYLSLDTFEGRPRTKAQIEAVAGALCGEARNDENKTKVFFGLFKEPDIDIPLDEDDEIGNENESETGTKAPSKKKKKKEFLSKKTKTDPNAPLFTRIPLPEPKDADKAEQMAAAKESLRRVRLGGSTAPSVLCYTIHNAFGDVTCVDICDDSSLLAAGFRDSHIRVWTLTPRPLKSVKPPAELLLLDKESDKILDNMMDESSSSEFKKLLGHSGIVYSVSFSPCRTMLVSSSEDGTVRLWSLLTWTNLMIYKGHLWPVWGVSFSPIGHYIISCGQDRLARLWVTDHYQPVRIFAGHLSDVDCVAFHHNCNYIATGSSDRVVRVWDVLTGNSVRVFTGHKKPVLCLAWSPDGRYLASGGSDGQVLVWDIQSKSMVARFNKHIGSVFTICFSRDGEVLASG